MADFVRGDVSIHYELHGDGPPVLAFAPGGMRSEVAWWSRLPWNPVVGLADGHRVIAMDQRNAGGSRAPVTGEDGWASYTADHLALLDHLGIERCALVGCCIGGSFALALCKAAPERVSAAVLMQPIGAWEGNRSLFYELFDGWAAELAPTHAEAGPAEWAAFRARMYDGSFVYSVTPDDVRACATPLLVLQGDDRYHPAAISREVAALAPNAELVERWKDEASLPAAVARIRAFLAEHAA